MSKSLLSLVPLPRSGWRIILYKVPDENTGSPVAVDLTSKISSCHSFKLLSSYEFKLRIIPGFDPILVSESASKRTAKVVATLDLTIILRNFLAPSVIVWSSIFTLERAYQFVFDLVILKQLADVLIPVWFGFATTELDIPNWPVASTVPSKFSTTFVMLANGLVSVIVNWSIKIGVDVSKTTPVFDALPESGWIIRLNKVPPFDVNVWLPVAVDLIS